MDMTFTAPFAIIRLIGRLSAFLALFSLVGCVIVGVDGETLMSNPPSAKQIVIVVNDGRSVSGLNQKEIDNLASLLKTSIPAVFSKNGFPAERGSMLTAKGLVLTVTPARTYYFKTRNYIEFNAILITTETQQVVWRGSVDVGFTPPFHSLNEDTADKMALRLLEQLRADKAVTRSRPKKPQAPSDV